VVEYRFYWLQVALPSFKEEFGVDDPLVGRTIIFPSANDPMSWDNWDDEKEVHLVMAILTSLCGGSLRSFRIPQAYGVWDTVLFLMRKMGDDAPSKDSYK
jgi:hypothetical protein